MGRAEQITTHLRKYDYKLYCGENKEGTLCIYREGRKADCFQVGDNVVFDVRPAPHFIFALTDNWKTTGRPRDWGIEPIMFRIKEIDGWARNVAQELIKGYEKDAASKDRDMDNQNEAFLSDFRKQFAKSTDGINTGAMTKKRGLKNGNH